MLASVSYTCQLNSTCKSVTNSITVKNADTIRDVVVTNADTIPFVTSLSRMLIPFVTGRRGRLVDKWLSAESLLVIALNDRGKVVARGLSQPPHRGKVVGGCRDV